VPGGPITGGVAGDPGFAAAGRTPGGAVRARLAGRAATGSGRSGGRGHAAGSASSVETVAATGSGSGVAGSSAGGRTGSSCGKDSGMCRLCSSTRRFFSASIARANQIRRVLVEHAQIGLHLAPHPIEELEDQRALDAQLLGELVHADFGHTDS
jgi:hypothetical protein